MFDAFLCDTEEAVQGLWFLYDELVLDECLKVFVAFFIFIEWVACNIAVCGEDIAEVYGAAGFVVVEPDEKAALGVSDFYSVVHDGFISW